MPSTYANNLRLENIANGEQSGSWGDTTNKNICSLLVDSITAVTTVSITGLANYILSANAGTTDESRTAVLKFTGSLAADCTITAPPVAKTYLIDNYTDFATGGNNNVIIKTLAGVGATVPFGKYTVYCDGLDFFFTGFSANGGVINGNAATTGNFIAGNNLTALGSTTLATTLTGALVGTAGFVSAVAPGTVGNLLTSNGTAWTSASNAPFTVGTKLIFPQATAPTGWTKDTTAAINDSILRFVTGTTGGTAGGSAAFSTWNGQTATGAHTLTTAEMPIHTHTGGSGNTTPYFVSQGYSHDGPIDGSRTVNPDDHDLLAAINYPAGGGTSHTHPLTQNIKYYDSIIASKD